MFITPITPLNTLNGLNRLTLSFENENQNNVGGLVFNDIFSKALSDVKTTEKALADSQYLMSIGEISDAHTLPIASAKAQLSIDLMVQLRNKSLEAYNEIMRINL